VYQEGGEDGFGGAAAGGADRLFSSPLCSRGTIAFSSSFWEQVPMPICMRNLVQV